MSNFGSGYIKYINHLEQINDCALSDPRRMIGEVETAYREHIESIARSIVSHYGGAKVCMLAGPSASGKTTTAMILRDCLTALGVTAAIVSLDDFYLGGDETPTLPNGEKDYESVRALDIPRIKSCLQGVIAAGRCTLPRYDFTTGRRMDETVRLDVGEKGFVIFEGIHALNPVFTEDLPERCAIKLYVSVKQNIQDANGEVISPMDLRLVRRVARDVLYRGTGAERTLALWPNVVEGEDRYIRPYRLAADYTVNSVHIYEPCVLRGHVIPLLREIREESPLYRKARDLEARLMRFEPVDGALVPENSMLREFMGGTGERAG